MQKISLYRNRNPVNLKLTIRPEVSVPLCITICIYFDYIAPHYYRLEWKFKLVLILYSYLTCYTEERLAHIKSIALIARQAVTSTMRANEKTDVTFNSKMGYYCFSALKISHISGLRWYLRSFSTSKQGLNMFNERSGMLFDMCS